MTAPPAQAATVHRRVSVWLPYWNMTSANSSVTANSSVISTASPFWYAIKGDSTLVSYSGSGSTSLINGWHSRHLRVVPTVTESQNAHDFGLMGTSSSRRAAHVATLSRIVRSRSYDGLDLDYENLAVFRSGYSTTDAKRASQALSLVVGDTCTHLRDRPPLRDHLENRLKRC